VRERDHSYQAKLPMSATTGHAVLRWHLQRLKIKVIIYDEGQL